MDNPLRFTDPLGLWVWEFGGCYFDTVEVEVNATFKDTTPTFSAAFPADGSPQSGG